MVKLKRRTKKEIKQLEELLDRNFTYIKKMYLEGKTLKEIALELTGMEYDSKRISNLLKSNEVNVSYFTYDFNREFFKIIDTEEKAYWLGFIYADGHIVLDDKYNTGKLVITLSEIDKSHLKKFRHDISSNHPINTYSHTSGFKTKNKYSRIVLTSVETVNDLIDKGAIPNKTELITFPSDKIVPNNLTRHFIRGYLDGDGSIIEPKSKKYQLAFCGTKEFLNSIQDYWNLNLKLTKRHDNNINNYILAIAGNLQVERLLNYLYSDATIYLDRKYERFIRLKKLNELKKDLLIR